MGQLTQVQSVIITGVISVIVGILTLAGVIYQSNKIFDKQKAEADTERKLLAQEFRDYKDLIHQVNKDIKSDVEKLSRKVDEHNNYGVRIPVLEKEIEGMKIRISNLEDK